MRSKSPSRCIDLLLISTITWLTTRPPCAVSMGMVFVNIVSCAQIFCMLFQDPTEVVDIADPSTASSPITVAIWCSSSIRTRLPISVAVLASSANASVVSTQARPLSESTSGTICPVTAPGILIAFFLPQDLLQNSRSQNQARVYDNKAALTSAKQEDAQSTKGSTSSATQPLPPAIDRKTKKFHKSVRPTYRLVDMRHISWISSFCKPLCYMLSSSVPIGSSRPLKHC